MSPKRWCVVTGGRGFAARHLVEMLIRNQIYHVRIADLCPVVQLEQHEEEGTLGYALRRGRARYVCMDLENKPQVLKGFKGAEVVFHMATPESSINNYQLHHCVNVVGTQNVVDACIELKVKRLIYTSSPSVVTNGKHAIFNVNESLPYPAKHNDSYSATIAEGEALVIKSNGKNGLLTCSLRPSGIFGPGDRLLVPSIVAAARAGKSDFIIGDGNNFYDFTYVENVAHAHICADKALALEGTAEQKASGQAYFITNTEPIEFWEFVSEILEGLGYRRPIIKIPVEFLMPIAYMVEIVYRLLGPKRMKVPHMIPSRIRLVTQSRTFNCSKARYRLGYTPVVPLQEGLTRTFVAYKHLRAGVQFEELPPSNAYRFLGKGKVADALLWRRMRLTFVMMLSLATFYFYFIASGYTFVTAVSKLLSMAMVFLFINDILPVQLFGFRMADIPESKFYVSEGMSRQVAESACIGWKSAVTGLQTIHKGYGDWMIWLKVVLFMLLIKIIAMIPLVDLFSIVLLAMAAVLIYDKNEEGIDNFIHVISFCVGMWFLLNYFALQVLYTLYVRDKREMK